LRNTCDHVKQFWAFGDEQLRKKEKRRKEKKSSARPPHGGELGLDRRQFRSDGAVRGTVEAAAEAGQESGEQIKKAGKKEKETKK